MISLVLFTLGCAVAAQSTTDAQNATTFALLYGYPLLAWEKFISIQLNGSGPNVWHHARELATPEDHSVVKFNVDTIYSNLEFDLSASNVEVTLPQVPDDQFALFSFYDPYGDNFASVGTLANISGPGKYLIRPLGSNSTIQAGAQAADNTTEGGYVAYINSPCAHGVLLIRWVLNSINLPEIHSYQDQCAADTVARASDESVFFSNAPKLEVATANDTATLAEKVLGLLSRYNQYTVPTSPGAAAYVQAQLSAAGVANGSFTLASNVNITLANSTAVALAEKAGTSPPTVVQLNNGWSQISPDIMGTFSTGQFETDYATRMSVAFTVYLGVRPPFAIYPTYSNATTAANGGALTVGANESILFTFSGKPPLMKDGFWSLTAYDADYFLIANSLNRYSLGDRSNLTFANGERLYGGDSSSDGSFQILVQPADVVPPANWTNNWLPAPAGGGDVNAQLRWYGGQSSLIDGSYVYPVLTRQAAISNGTASSTGTPTSSPTAAQTGRASKLQLSFGLASLVLGMFVIRVL